MTFILGLTGGIATGKSTVANYLAEQGIPVVDADVGAREVVKPHSEGLRRIVEAFGEEILLEDGSLNRKRLGELVFSQEEKRHILNSIVHVLIREWIQTKTKLLTEEGIPLIVWDIPLLYETNYQIDCDLVMVVYVPKELQIQRLMNRDKLTLEQAEDRIHTQMPIEEKRIKANILINNSGSIEDTYLQLDSWLKENASLLE
ncbi:dephospho-CoA kinase [Jeotgalibaca sp. MA1X17-3]|uniref:dephospho-CoA kinase n=1 Tax=Jeotgalibaca sp. MA1X17-3 TaxID=2908211 RepID=UPI001EEB07B6|nr:dephospho-CoA kinase [Jeotgalibaca sp. MA1X17-3]UJF15177.1 dephospho-CoA kinase [Jeotgalibaca sp. MA1X17-3]